MEFTKNLKENLKKFNKLERFWIGISAACLLSTTLLMNSVTYSNARKDFRWYYHNPEEKTLSENAGLGFVLTDAIIASEIQAWRSSKDYWLKEKKSLSTFVISNSVQYTIGLPGKALAYGLSIDQLLFTKFSHLVEYK